MVKAQLQSKDHWEESDDLAMMFQGTYQTPFYRHLHALLHRDLTVRQQLQTADNPEILRDLDELNRDWFVLGQMESRYRSANPTVLHKPYEQLHAPDLSKEWN